MTSIHVAKADIDGQVVNKDGQPVPFASVAWAKGAGMVADDNGRFVLPEAARGAELRVTAIGFDPAFVQVGETEKTLVVRLVASVTELSEVVITGYIDPQSARQSVYQVRTISMEMIQNKAAGNIQQVLNTELGIRFGQDNALGSSNLEMLGLTGQNVKVLIDGVPMVGRQGVNNEININQIDVNLIERIEIVEGPMSVVYGADALAGVINIITKRPDSSRVQVNVRMREESVGQEYQFMHGAGNRIRSIQTQWGLSESLRLGVGISQNLFGGWKGDQVGRQFAWLPKAQHIANTQLNFAKDELGVQYALDFLDEKVESLGPENRIEVIDSDFETKRIMHRLNATFAFSPKVKSSLQAGYTDYSRATVTSVTNMRTGQQALSLAPGSQAQLSYHGLNVRLTTTWYQDERLSWTGGIDFNDESGVGDRISENQGITDVAGFLSAEWKPTGKINIKPGIRSTYNSAYAAPAIIPSVNGRVDLSKTMNLKFGYANGFRAPSIRELYFDFFDASHSIVGNPELKAETSHSFNASLGLNPKVSGEYRIESLLSGFYNDVKNQIAYGVLPEDARITSLFNLDEFRTTGVMLRNKIVRNENSFDFGFSRIGRMNVLSREVADLAKMLWSTEVNASLSRHLKAIDCHVNVFYKWTGMLPGFELDASNVNGVREVQIDGFHWMDVTVSKTVVNDLNLQLGVINAFNVRNIQSTAGVGSAHGGGPSRPIGYGRSLIIGISYQFSK